MNLRRSLVLDQALSDAIDAFRFSRKYRSETEALRDLVWAGLKALGEPVPADVEERLADKDRLKPRA